MAFSLGKKRAAPAADDAPAMTTGQAIEAAQAEAEALRAELAGAEQRVADLAGLVGAGRLSEAGTVEELRAAAERTANARAEMEAGELVVGELRRRLGAALARSQALTEQRRREQLAAQVRAVEVMAASAHAHLALLAAELGELHEARERLRGQLPLSSPLPGDGWYIGGMLSMLTEAAVRPAFLARQAEERREAAVAEELRLRQREADRAARRAAADKQRSERQRVRAERAARARGLGPAPTVGPIRVVSGGAVDDEL